MRAIREPPLSLSAAIWQAGLEETARIERKAKRPPLPEGVTKKECRRETLKRLRALAAAKRRGVNVSAEPMRAHCEACRRCGLAPGLI